MCFRKGRLFEEIIKNSTYMYFNRIGSCRWFLGYMTLTKEQPADVVSLKVENNKERVLGTGNEFKVTTFNIGYGGLDKDQDFFMDGERDLVQVVKSKRKLT